ncbi:hypothetical protein ACR8AL_14685 [Clavibacter sepedonicus]|uniref:Exported protein n=1 Tax=Clavibacter sepedonicus TaxID=31964 RepID=B0RD78_CLASE|nr:MULTISPECIES: hypothetical protein [Clavibacter]MBD5381307.1 hypothetical protein [Clavibacter sp.]OQJ49636.1 hypothetical protein B5P19_13095 [Clavibacter sepedonicus]OQJ55406.1 hypothetical protein B5P20_05355 [Clavibacter sepedonicus]UUK65109.1 hypothetical protein LRE50_12580 [Clavibacter sepedonicus]CAQ00677.1 putative exported protein [Clavibacter sepedonicus]
MSSTSTSPGGRPSAAVYRRRRLLALLVVVAVIAVVVIIVSNLGRGTADTAAPGATPTADAAPDAAAPADPDPTPSATASAGTETNADGSCAAGQLTVTPVTDAASYKAGVLPKLSFTVTNTGMEPCTANLGTTTQVFTISSGSDVYWKSTDCQTGAEDAQVELAARTPQTSSPFEWSRQRSSTTTCEEKQRPAVPAGGATYTLSVEVAGVKSAEPKSFLLY